ncbi:hypothetical protein Z043_125435 [Scleropages formosus]|uniref:LIM zinc-binding domain-containing protein n=1 Tax=Scleropages formosus TaxID=113540 RepID=A0A0P7UB19_SCLFO|nr:hypothetical protein Z043_125435 [Scleropages formosus]
MTPMSPTKEFMDREYSRTISTEYSPRSSVTTRSYSTYSSGDYTPSTRMTSTTYSTTSTDPRPEDYLSDSIVSTSTKTLYSTLDRSVTEKDMCSYCRKPMNIEPKVILDDIQINCHASCFKCDVCNGPLGHLKAGDTMWVYRGNVHCERCFGIARGTIPPSRISCCRASSMMLRLVQFAELCQFNRVTAPVHK